MAAELAAKSGEEWALLVEYPPYQVSTWGNIRYPGRPNRALIISSVGYPIVSLDVGTTRKTLNIHRLVATTFIPNPNNLAIVDHIDGNKSNNHASNLEWVTVVENRRRWADKDSRVGGPTRRVVQMTVDDRIIREWNSLIEAAKHINVNSTTITRACRNQTILSGCKWQYADTLIAMPENEEWRLWSDGLHSIYVSSMGRTKSTKGRILNNHKHGGYLLYRNYRIHRMVAEIFPDICPKADGANIVNHIDGNKLNNKAANLEWTTPAENSAHAVRIGNWNSRPVRRLDNGNVYSSLTEAAKKNNVDASDICRSCKYGILNVGGAKWEYIDRNTYESGYVDTYLYELYQCMECQ